MSQPVYHVLPHDANTHQLCLPGGNPVGFVPALPIGAEVIERVAGFRYNGASQLTYEKVRLVWPARAWKQEALELQQKLADLESYHIKLQQRGPLKFTEAGVSGTYRRAQNRRLADAHASDLHKLESAARQVKWMLKRLDYSA